MTTVRERLRELIAPEGAALDLAVLRITVMIVLAASASVAVADHWAALPAATRVAPLGVGWALEWLPIEPAIVRTVRIILWIACALGGIGLLTRMSLAVATLCASYVLLVPQLGGAVFHDHHLLWLCALLAASPSGDALSVDAWLARRGGRPLPQRGRAHGAAIRVAWILIGVVFFFPGVHKLAGSGVAWIASDNLRNQMWWKWAQDPAMQPAWRIDRHPLLLRVLAFLTVAFELSFLPLVLWRRTRALAVGAALAFHAATDVFMGIAFSALWATYTMFVPWEQLLRRVRPSMRREGGGTRSIVPVAIIGAILIGGAASFGAMGAMHAYPFACYPTFQWIPADRMPAMAIELERADGTRELLDPALYREPGPRGWALGVEPRRRVRPGRSRANRGVVAGPRVARAAALESARCARDPRAPHRDLSGPRSARGGARAPRARHSLIARITSENGHVAHRSARSGSSVCSVERSSTGSSSASIASPAARSAPT